MEKARTQTYGRGRQLQTIFAKLLRLTDGKRVPGWIVLMELSPSLPRAPINKFMLDNILKGSNFDSYIFSLFLTLIMLLLAHMVDPSTPNSWCISGDHLRQQHCCGKR